VLSAQENFLNPSVSSHSFGLSYTTFHSQFGGISIITEVLRYGMLTSVLYLLQGKSKYLDTLHKYLEIHGTFFGVKVLGRLLSSIYYLKLKTNQQTKN